MKTLHILITLTLSISTHLILILGIQDPIDSTHPNNNVNPIKVSLSTSRTSTLNPHEKSALQTQAFTPKTQQTLTPKKSILKQPPIKTTPPSSNQTAKSTSTTNLKNHIEPAITQTQTSTPPPTIKATTTNKPLSDILSEAHALTQIRTKYPSFSRRRGEEGLVKLAIHINDEGKITNINIVQSSGHSRLDQAAKTAVEQASFTPATLNNKVVASIKKLSVRFDLRDPS